MDACAVHSIHSVTSGSQKERFVISRLATLEISQISTTWCAASYGDRAHMVTKIAEERKLGRRLVRGHPMLEAEVVYAVQNEYCETAEDFIARRTRLAFLDVAACREALPRVSKRLSIKLCDAHNAGSPLASFECTAALPV